MISPSSSSSSLSEWWSKLNRNVRLIFIFTLFNTAGLSLYGQSIFAVYIYVVSHNSHMMVGYVSFIRGMALILLAFPSGYLSDRLRRENMLRFSGTLGVASMIFGFLTFHTGSFHYMYVFALINGAYMACNNTAAESIFADSVTTGERSQLYAYKHSVMMIAASVGPLMSCVLFLCIGDVWSLRSMFWALVLGLFIALPGVISLFFFSDELSQKVLDSAIYPTTTNTNTTTTTATVLEVVASPKSSSSSSLLPPPRPPPPSMKLNKHAINVPLLLVVGDVITAVGAGQTIQYFPIFFKEVYHFTPFHVAAVFACCSLATAGCAIITQRVSVITGRFQAIFLAKSLGIIFLVLICITSNGFIGAILYIVRTATQQSAKPLSRSLLMEYVAVGERGRWNAVESITQATWTGSALIGGYLVEKYGYITCFLVTAVLYCFGIVPMLFLWISERRMNAGHQQSIAREDDDDDDGGDDDEDDEHDESSRLLSRTV